MRFSLLSLESNQPTLHLPIHHHHQHQHPQHWRESAKVSWILRCVVMEWTMKGRSQFTDSTTQKIANQTKPSKFNSLGTALSKSPTKLLKCDVHLLCQSTSSRPAPASREKPDKWKVFNKIEIVPSPPTSVIGDQFERPPTPMVDGRSKRWSCSLNLGPNPTTVFQIVKNKPESGKIVGKPESVSS